jgi:hypothetical protein
MYQQGFNIDRALNDVYNTESCIVINSLNRNLAVYPNAYHYQFQIPNSMGNVMSVTLTHFITLAEFPAAPPPLPNAIYITVDELNPTLVYTPNFIQQGTVFVIPVIFQRTSIEYEAHLEFSNKAIFPKDKRPNIHTLTFTLYNEFGQLIVGMPDHIMKLQVRSYY